MDDTKLMDDTVMDDEDFRISQRFPNGQGKRTDDMAEQNAKKNPEPQNDSEMITYIMTMAKDCQATLKTMARIKTHVTFAQNLKNLADIKKEEAKTCLAFLLRCEESDVRITKYRVEGLR